MLTAVHEIGAIANYPDIGADDYIEKPFFPRELIARIQAKLSCVRGELCRTDGQI
jgi:DNA-binding response OmpR family regulator